jgi:hypothetical protein
VVTVIAAVVMVDIPMPIMHFAAVKLVVEIAMLVPVGVPTALRQCAVIAVVGVIARIHPSVKIARTMEPRTSADENPVCEPCRAVIAVWSTAIRRVGKISIRANRLRTDLDA